MTGDQATIFAILGGSLVLFAWGRWRYDIVAMLALLAAVGSGLVPAPEAFAGFAHPAVVTVAAVLVISRGLQNAGLVDLTTRLLAPLRGRETLQIAAQTGLIAFLSSFMNNVGAMALMLPVALRNAYRSGYAPAKALMPLAFGSLLGGLTTLIGTPPNLIVAGFRADALGRPFGMFDFAPVGLAVAIAGVAFISLIGWRLIPKGREGAPDPENLFNIEDYVSEARVPEGSDAAGRRLQEIEDEAEGDVTVAGIARGERRALLPSGYERIAAGDVLILKGDPKALEHVVNAHGLELVGSGGEKAKALRSEEVGTVEAVIKPGSILIGGSPRSLALRRVHGVNLLALARHGRPIRERLGAVRFQPGDVLLLQGRTESLADTLTRLDCLPLAERRLKIGQPQRLLLALLIFGAAIAATVAGLAPAHIAFAAAAVLFVLGGIVATAELYTSVDWPVIVLLGAMFAVGGAMESSGAAALVADSIVGLTKDSGAVVALLLLLVGTMFLSDLINNNATAVLMAPIALGVAGRLEAGANAFLMAVAIGASSAFLTPIGHQSNTLVMAPGGYRFGDYWRMGLPLEVLIVAVALPMILLVWPP